MERTAVSELREVNCRLGAALSKLQIGHRATPEDFSSLRGVLVLGARATRQVSRLLSPDSEWLAELSAYRSNLNKLRQVLPSLNLGLQVRKRRLQSALDTLQAASKWAQASKESL